MAEENENPTSDIKEKAGDLKDKVSSNGNGGMLSSLMSKEILIPALNERRALPLNQAVRIDVPNGVADTLNYICGMHMLGGTVAAK